MMQAPFRDYKGHVLYEGDKIRHPDGTVGTIEFWKDLSEAQKKEYFIIDASDRWRVRYDDGLTPRLVLQIGERGQAEYYDEVRN